MLKEAALSMLINEDPYIWMTVLTHKALLLYVMLDIIYLTDNKEAIEYRTASGRFRHVVTISELFTGSEEDNHSIQKSPKCSLIPRKVVQCSRSKKLCTDLCTNIDNGLTAINQPHPLTNLRSQTSFYLWDRLNSFQVWRRYNVTDHVQSVALT